MGAGSSDEAKAAPGTSLWLGLAWAVAFSPVLMDSLRHLLAEPWARGALIFPWLVFVAARVDRPVAAPPFGRRVVALALGLALVLQLAAIAGDAVRIARAGVVLAAAVALWGSGTVGPRTAILALWMLPVPSFLVDAASPFLETTVARAAALWPGLSLAGPMGDAGGAGAMGGAGPALITAAGPIDLAPIDGGLVLAIGLAGVQWARAVLGGASLAGCVRAALVGTILALPLQILVLVGVGAMVASGAAPIELARPTLDQVGWVLVVASGCVVPILSHPGAGAERRRGERGSLPC